MAFRIGKYAPYGSQTNYGIEISTPLAIPNCGLWFDFNDISTLFQDTARTTPVTTNGQNIAGVTDKSGSGNHGSSASPTKPTYNTGGFLGKCFTTTVGYLTTSYVPATGNGSRTICALITGNDTGAAGVYFGYGTNSSGQLYAARKFGVPFKLNIDYNGSLLVGNAILANNMIIMRYNGVTDQLYRNGYSQASQNITLNTGSGNGFFLGGNLISLAIPFECNEVAVYNRWLQDHELNLITTYMMRKWNI